MSALDDARAALAAWDDGGRILPSHLATALRALIAEHERAMTVLRDRYGHASIEDAERLTTPPADDEREALLRALDDHIGICVCQSYRREKHDVNPACPRVALADSILAAGFRLPGPIADAQVEAAAKTLIQAEPSEPWPDASTWGGIVAYGAAVGGIDELRDFARAALEAAASVEGDAS